MVGNLCIKSSCIGCGFCSLVCPVDALKMQWANTKTWQPVIEEEKCTDCGLCIQVCPNSISNLAETGKKAWEERENFGIEGAEYSYAITYENEAKNRIRSASGGTSTLLLKYLLESKQVDCVICAESKMAPIGEPHFSLRICYSPEEIDNCRSSAYGPIRYDQVLQELIAKRLTCAMTALPCTLRAIGKLPKKYRKHILFTVGIICSHNVTDQFTDFLAHKHGIRNEMFRVNLRDKEGTPDANQFNTCFHLNNGKVIRTPRLENGFTQYWREYWFAQEACFYCPDFYAVDADISVKDAWGKLSNDPLGLTLCIVRNDNIRSELKKIAATDKLSVTCCDRSEIQNSQNATAIYKQVKIWTRWFEYPELKKEMIKWTGAGLFLADQSELKDFQIKLKQSKMTRNIYSDSSHAGYNTIMRRIRITSMISKIKTGIKLLFLFFQHVKNICLRYAGLIARVLGYLAPFRPRDLENGPLRVLITGGYGYGNVGDEAQLGANINRWKKNVRNCDLTIFTPHPAYTHAHHEEHSVNGPRVVWFNSNLCGDYSAGNQRFKKKFSRVKRKMLIAARMIRAGLPVPLLRSDEAALLNQVHRADVLHISGGGFLTGMTLSRLWENMLLIKMAHLLGTPVILSGQTIGVFKNNTNRKLAKWGLENARYIYLRDNGDSEEDVNSLGFSGNHIKSTFDDALFCERMAKEAVFSCLNNHGLDTEKPYVVVQFHYWGQTPEIQQSATRRFAQICDFMFEKHGVQILFVPMVHTDKEAEKAVIQLMRNPSFLLDYNYDYRIARGIMAEALLTFTLKHHPIIFSMGESVPSVAVCLDDYYYRKNLGALANCGHEEYCLDSEAYMGQKAVDVINKAIKDNLSLRKEIQLWIDKAQKIENEVINRYLHDDVELLKKTNIDYGIYPLKK